MKGRKFSVILTPFPIFLVGCATANPAFCQDHTAHVSVIDPSIAPSDEQKSIPTFASSVNSPDRDRAPVATAVLAAYSPFKVMLNEELSSQMDGSGTPFTVTVLEDVNENDTVVIPAGALGHGEVTFSTSKGSFGKPGIIAISLRRLELEDRVVSLDGRFREEGKNNNGATAATWFAVGLFAGAIKGRPGYIEKGRELKARTGEPILYTIGEDARPASNQELTSADDDIPNAPTSPIGERENTDTSKLQSSGD